MKPVVTITKIALLIFIYYCVYFFYTGIVSPVPGLGDSWDYHIPISQSILDGRFLTLPYARIPQWYYPGSSEAINSILLLLHIPLTISNLLAILVLFFSCIKLGKTFRLETVYALLFALSFCSLTVIVRWMNAVSIDVWVAVFFVLSLILLEQPKKTWNYFATLGFTLGMLVGSKYTACLFVGVLFLFYSKSIKTSVSFGRIIAFLVPFSVFGLFWYIRNYLLVHNPFYPMAVLGLPGMKVFMNTILEVTLLSPFQMLNALFSEYKFWTLCPVIAVVWLWYRFITKRKALYPDIEKLFMIGLINLILFSQFPSNDRTEIMISSLRYSYPIFIPLLLGTFMLASKYHKEEFVGYITIATMINVMSMAYYPKLLLFYLPLAYVGYYLVDKISKENKSTLK